MQSADNPQNKLQGIIVNPQPIFWTLLSLINGHTPWESRHPLNYNGLMHVEHIQIHVCNVFQSCLEHFYKPYKFDSATFLKR